MCNVRKMKRRGIKSGNYIEYNCVLQFVLFAMLSCAEIYLLKTKLKKEKRIKQVEKQERKIINNKTIGKIANFS